MGSRIGPWQVASLLLLMAAAAYLMLHVARPLGTTAVESSVAGDGFPRTIVTDDGPLIIPRRPQRIVSHTVGTDEILLALGVQERLSGIHKLSLEPRYSNVAKEAAPLADRIVGSAESVIARNPDLVFAAFYSQKETLDQIRAASQATLVRLTRFDTLDDVRHNIRLVGQAIGEDLRADELVKAMDQRIAAIVNRLPKDRPGPAVLSFEATGSTAGSGTIFDDVCKTLRLRNLASAHGIQGWGRIGTEQAAGWRPDLLLRGGEPGEEETTRQQLETDPVISGALRDRKGRVVIVPQPVFYAVSQHIATLVELLAREAYPDLK